MKVIIAIGLLCLSTICVLAQAGGKITGTVKASPTVGDRPVEIIVSLTATERGRVKLETRADADGKYRFENVPSGTYNLTAQADISEIDLSDSVKVSVADGSAQNFDLQIRLRNSLPDEVVTISADQNQPVEEVSKTVNIIEALEMRERADFTLTDTLRTVPGFRVQQLGGFGRTATIKARGLRNQDTAVLIDGIRFRDASAITGDASPFLSDFTLTSVSRIEVLRGSGSSLYGTNAIGGTIDFQTPKPRSGFHGQLSTAFGGYGLGRFRGNVSDGTDDGKFGFNIGVSRTSYTRGIDGQDNAHNTNFQSRIEYNPFSKTNISARFFVSDAFVRLNTNPNTIGPLPASNANIIDAVPLPISELERYENGRPFNRGNANFIPDANDPDNFQKSQFLTGQAAITHVINNKLVFQGFYQGLRTSRRNTNGPMGVAFQPFSGADESDIFKAEIHTINGHFNWTPNRFSETKIGYEYELEKFGDDHLTVNIGDNFSIRAKQSSNTIYVQELLSFLDDRLQISGSFRAQFFSLNKPVFTPENPTYQNLTLDNPPTAYTGDGSISYFVRTTNTKFRAHVGNGYRVPSLYERFGTFYFFGYSNSGNPNLAPERSTAFDAGIDQSFFTNRLKFSATYFYTDIGKSIDFAFCVPRCLATPDPFERFSGYYNTEGRISRGVETSIDLKPIESTRIFASYAFVNSDERNPLNLFVRRSPGVPSQQFSAVVTQRIGKRLSLNFDFVATSSYLFPFYNFNFNTFEEKYYMYRFKGSRRGDFTARYEIPAYGEKVRFTMFGTIENLFDDEYYENGFRTVGRSGRAGVSFSF